MTEQTFTTKQAAAYLKIAVATIRYHLGTGRLVASTVGRELRFSRRVLDDFKRAGRAPYKKPKVIVAIRAHIKTLGAGREVVASEMWELVQQRGGRQYISVVFGRLTKEGLLRRGEGETSQVRWYRV